MFEIEVLNRHIKQENEALKEQSKVEKMVHDNTMLHLGLWRKKNRKLKGKCKKLSRALINLRFRCLVKKPRTILAARRKKRRLDVLAEASEHMDWKTMTKFWLHEDMQHLHSGGMLSLKPTLLYTSSQPPFPIHFLLLPLIPSIKLLKSLYFRNFYMVC